MGCFCKVWNLVWLMNRISEEYYFNKLSPLRSQLEYWNVGMMCLNRGLRPKAKGARYNQCLLPYALSLVPYAIHNSMHEAKNSFNFSKL